MKKYYLVYKYDVPVFPEDDKNLDNHPDSWEFVMRFDDKVKAEEFIWMRIGLSSIRGQTYKIQKIYQNDWEAIEKSLNKNG